MKFGISELKKVLFWLIYLGLAGVSFLFVQQTLKQYSEGVTYFQDTNSLMGVKDVPTLTICMESKESLEFGKHFTVENSNLKLTKGKNEPKSDKGISHDLFLKTMKVYQHDEETKRRCITISPMTENGLEHPNLRPYMQAYDLEILFNESAIIDSVNLPEKANLYVTSEENAYGATFQKWYEGKVEQYVLKYKHEYHINLEVKEIRHHPDRCHDQPFYMCLANKISKDTTCSDSQCTTITLPTNTTFIDFDECKTQEESKCKENVLRSMVKEIEQKNEICNGNMEPPCAVKEYMLEEISAPILKSELQGFHILLFLFAPLSSHTNRITGTLRTLFTIS